MDWTALTKELMLILSSLGLTFTSCLAGGCIIHLTGEGEVAVGMRNTNEVYLRHEVDGDKMESTSASGMKLNQETWDWINDRNDEPDENKNDPCSPDGDGPSGIDPSDG